MPPSKAAKTFDEHFPDITDDDVRLAAEQKQIVLSFAALPSSEAIIAKFVIADGSIRTMILPRHVCEVFRLLVEKMNAGDWKVYRDKPPGQPPGQPH